MKTENKDIILSIEKVTEPDGYRGYMGYVITTTQQVIRVLISMRQSCCEKFDVDLILPVTAFVKIPETPPLKSSEELIGHEVLQVNWGSLKLDTTEVYDKMHATVHMRTSAGLIQLVAWNEHNGYYPHNVKVTWKKHGKDYEDKQEI